MRTPALLSVPLAVAALVGVSLAFANRTPQSASITDASASVEEEGPLEEAMYDLKNHLKKLARALAPETREEALEHVTAMQRIVVDSKELMPSNIDQLAEGDHDAHRLEYRKEMLTLLTELIAIEMDVMDGNNAGAMERLRGPLLEIRNRSHEKFQPEE